MHRRARVPTLLGLALALLGIAPRALADSPSGEPRLRLVWIAGSDDFLRPPSVTLPAARGFGIGDRPGYGQFFDALAFADRGRENVLELALASRAPGFVAGVETRAELVAAFDLESWLGQSEVASGAPRTEDRGSALGLRAALGAGAALDLELFPFDTDRIRLGGLRALDWGGTDARRAESSFPGAEPGVPGARATLSVPGATAFVALKLADPRERSAAPLFGLLSGARVDVEALAVSFGVGLIQHPELAAHGGPASRGFAAAANLRAVLRRGTLPDARAPGSFTIFRPESPERAPGSGFALALEATGLVQRLADSDRPGYGVMEPARAVVLQGELAGSGLDSALALSVRELSFVVRHVPGILPQQSVPRAGRAEPELGASVSTAVTALGRLVPELTLGLTLPATFTPRDDAMLEPVVVRGPGDLALLVPGSARVPILESRVGLACRLSPLLSVGIFGSYRRDNNRTGLIRRADTVLLRRFEAPDFAGAGIVARADL